MKYWSLLTSVGKDEGALENTDMLLYAHLCAVGLGPSVNSGASAQSSCSLYEERAQTGSDFCGTNGRQRGGRRAQLAGTSSVQ